MIDRGRPALTDYADWLVSTVLLFGGSPGTAYKCAGLFVEAVEEAWAEQDSLEPKEKEPNES